MIHDNDTEAETLAAGRLGNSDTYPSEATGYGVEGLMAMAGSLIEVADQGVRAPDGHVVNAADYAEIIGLAGVGYAVLALTQAVRDLPEQIAAAIREADHG
jgi:hypothetical protein